MNCKEFQDLLPREKTEYIGQLIHACQSDSTFFVRGKTIIKQAEKMGLFTGVTINPPNDAPAINEPLNIEK